MADTDPSLPAVSGDLVTPNRKATAWFYAWFQRIERRLLQTQATADANAAAIADLPEAQPSPNIIGIDGVAVTGSPDTQWTVSGKALLARAGLRGRPGRDGEDAGEPWVIPGPRGRTGAAGASGSGGGGAAGMHMLIDMDQGEPWVIPGPPGSTGASGAGGDLEYIGEGRVSGSAATVVTLSGLNLDTDGHYLLELVFKNATASNATVSMYFNSDTTATNYDSQVVGIGGAATSPARANTARFFDLFASLEYAGEARIRKDHGARVRSTGWGVELSTTTMRLWGAGHMWRTSGTNVTGITFSSSVANSLAVDSYFKLWRLNT